MATYVKVCRECGEEYRPQAASCVECGGELEERQLDENGALIDAPGAETATEAEAPEDLSSHRIVFVGPRASELVPLAEALRESGIDYRLAERPAQREGAAASYALLVPEPAVSAALRALAPHVAPDQDAAAVEGIEAHFEAERGYLRCPACGVEQPPAAAECRECGLDLGSHDEEAASCARCGAPMPEPGAPCAACGSIRTG